MILINNICTCVSYGKENLKVKIGTGDISLLHSFIDLVNDIIICVLEHIYFSNPIQRSGTINENSTQRQYIIIINDLFQFGL